MTADAKPPQEKKPGKVRQFAATVFGWPWRLSLAAKAAWVLALFLIAVVAAVWIVLLVSPGYVPQRHALTGWLVAAILLLLAVIPFVFYYALRLWLQGERSRFPDIDFAWNAGLEALGRNGLAVDETPIFLALGSSGDQAERTLISAAGLGLRVAGAPEGPAPLHWYAGPDAIYLFCTEAGWLSALARLIEKKSRRMVAENPEGPLPAPRLLAAPPPPAPTRGTVTLDQFVPPPAPPPASAPGGPRDTVPEDESVLGTLSAQSSRRPSTRDTPRGTLVLGEGPPSMPAPPPDVAAPPPQPEPPIASPAPTEELPALLPPQDSAEQLERLEYVCGLLARAREPLCPLNGVLTLLPFETITAGQREAEELERAVKADVTAIQRETQLRCPVTALITGMEREEGFSELVRRVGPDRAAIQRFGRRFVARCLATREELGIMCEHFCGAFED
ncbi:MAG: type VI secretion protein IcmF/TssM N-terminal domain-containing protein, partial [Planctomycetaceae bacterium]